MDSPKFFSRVPSILELDPGEYWWCGCGLSVRHPFCDGSHKGSGFGPERIKIGKKSTAALCNCKASGNKPFCDGSHSQLS
ncbi:MAG: CDGSH iron-sulfur domain-containing protein [Verrucomicrobiales bacterium]